MNCTVWDPSGCKLPGKLREVELPITAVWDRGISVPGVAISDEQNDVSFETTEFSLREAVGAGPLEDRAAQRSARAFGVVNVAYHLYRAQEKVAELLGHALPPLVAKLGMHVLADPNWSGGHFRLPASTYATLPEDGYVASSGEIHFGAGGRYLRFENSRYFHRAAHNPGLIYHEFGHHVCCHTADFRLNRRRQSDRQANRKIPLDEGTSDYVAAILAGTPDIFGWHRAEIPRSLQQRRHLDAPWTMSHYVGSTRNDPHIDGTVWASALWATRQAFADRDLTPQHFDRLVLRGLQRIGRQDTELDWDEALRRRRHFSRALQAILDADAELGGSYTELIERTFFSRGILIGYSNRDLRDLARSCARRTA